jgi:hypothetical protein
MAQDGPHDTVLQRCYPWFYSAIENKLHHSSQTEASTVFIWHCHSVAFALQAIST